jgi:hypothetical protein
MALNTESNDSGNGNGTADEGANRTFRVAVIALGGIALLGVILIAVFLLGNSGQRQQLLAQQQAVNSTNEAATQIAQITPTDIPTDTPEPTETPKPPTTTPTLPPTAALTQAPQSVVATVAVGLVTSTPKSPSTPAVSGGTASPSSTKTSSVSSSTSVTSSTTLSNTGKTSDQIAKTGAGDYLGFLLAGGLIVLLFVARRLRTAQA